MQNIYKCGPIIYLSLVNNINIFHSYIKVLVALHYLTHFIFIILLIIKNKNRPIDDVE